MVIVNSGLDESKERIVSNFSKNAALLLNLSGSLVIQSISGFFISMSTFIWIGSLGPLATASCTLGNMYANITGMSLIYGMATALDSLCAQSYGAKQYKAIGVHTQRAVLILTLLSLPVVVTWIFAETVLHSLLFIPTEIAHLSGVWARTLSAGLWPLLALECLKKAMQARNIVWPAVLTTTIGLASNLAANYYCIKVLKWGFHGAAWIVPMQNWVHLILYVIIIRIRSYYKRREIRVAHIEQKHSYDQLSGDSTHGDAEAGSSSPKLEERKGNSEEDEEDDWPPLSAELFYDWNTFLNLGIPSYCSLFIEWGSFELAASIAAQLSTINLAAHGIFSTSAGLLYMMPLSISLATTTVAGQIIGSEFKDANDVKDAEKSKDDSHVNDAYSEARAILFLGVAVDSAYGFIAATALLLLRNVWGSFFTSDKATSELVTQTIPFLALYTLVDATKCITLNILRSGGLPAITVKVNALVCLTVLVPMGYYLAINQGRGLGGLWLAMSLAWALATVCFGVVLANLDLRKLKVIKGE